MQRQSRSAVRTVRACVISQLGDPQKARPGVTSSRRVQGKIEMVVMMSRRVEDLVEEEGEGEEGSKKRHQIDRVSWQLISQLQLDYSLHTQLS